MAAADELPANKYSISARHTDMEPAFFSAQYQVLLSIRGYGPHEQIAPGGAQVSVPSSLLDITPTLLDALNLNAPEPMDGQSLRLFWLQPIRSLLTNSLQPESGIRKRSSIRAASFQERRSKAVR